MEDARRLDGDRPATSETELLDRQLDLTTLSWSAIGWIAAFGVTLLIRLVGFTVWPLSPTEARIASDALALVQGGSISEQAASSPLPAQLVALSIFLFGAGDTAVRVVPLILGLATIALLLPLRSIFGRSVMLATAVVIVISPTLAFASKQIDAGALLVTAQLLLLWLLFRCFDQPTAGNGLLAGLSAAALVLADPLGWLALPLIVATALAISHRRTSGGAALPLSIAGFLGLVLLSSTSLFTRPGGFIDFLSSSFGDLWEIYLRPLGEQWYLVPFNLMTNEPFALALALGATVSTLRAHSPITEERPFANRALVAWAVAAVALSVAVGGKSASVYSLAALPLALLAGVGLSRLVEKVDWRAEFDRLGFLFVVTLLLSIAAAISLVGLLFGDPDDALAWFFKLVLLGGLILLPLVGLTIWIGRQMEAPAWPLVALAGLVFLFGLELRTSVMLGTTDTDRPGQLLTIGSTTPGTLQLVERIERLSRDVTTFQGDPRDPTGGHGLPILVDSEIAQPFAWYFREFPSLRVQDLDTVGLSAASYQVIIARPDRYEQLGLPVDGFVARQYAYVLEEPAAFRDPTWADIVQSLVDPDDLRRFGRFLLYRTVQNPAAPEQFTMGLSRDLADRVYGPDTR